MCPDFPKGAVVSPSSTRVIWRSNVELPHTLVDLSGSGSINSIFVISNSNEYKIYIEVDGNVIYDASFIQISSLPEEVLDVAAFYDEQYSKYILYIGDVSFASNVKVHLDSLYSPFIIDTIIAKLNVMI